MLTFSKDNKGNLQIEEQVTNVVSISRGKAVAELQEAQAQLAKLQSEVAKAEENITQKTLFVNKCEELSIK